MALKAVETILLPWGWDVEKLDLEFKTIAFKKRAPHNNPPSLQFLGL